MRARFRFFAALFALLALLAFTAEGVWASMCPEGSEGGVTISASLAEAAAPDDGCFAGAAEHSSSGSQNQDGNQSGVPTCPLVAVGFSCTGAVSLPALSVIPFAPSPEGALLTVSPDDARGISPVSALFRPPRA